MGTALCRREMFAYMGARSSDFTVKDLGRGLSPPSDRPREGALMSRFGSPSTGVHSSITRPRSLIFYQQVADI
jgi:hypothetical protein